MRKKDTKGKNDGHLDNLSSRLSHALKVLQISQAELARRIRIKPQAIHYLCSSRSKKSSFTYEIADALMISSLWLACGEGSMLPKQDPDALLLSAQRRVPVLDKKHIRLLTDKREKNPDSYENDCVWILTDSDAGKAGFAFRLPDTSMYPRFDQDTLIIINQERIPENKNFVLVRLGETDDIICRQYEIQSSSPSLNPVNVNMYKKITLKDEDTIIGVMVEARWNF